MADVSGLVISVLAVSLEITSTLYSYGKDVKGARKEIQSLSNELFGLIGVLEHLKTHLDPALDDDLTLVDTSEFAHVRLSSESIANFDSKLSSSIAQNDRHSTFESILCQTMNFLQELQQLLRIPKGRFAAAVSLLKWPLKKGELAKHLKRLERVKTFFVLSLVTDEVDLSRKAADEISELRTMMQEVSLEQNSATRRREHAEMMEWLSPVDPSTMRTSLSMSRAPGSGAWFLHTKAFEEWSRSTTSTALWLNGITGAGKSTLLTTVLDELSSIEEGQHSVAYFYCSFTDDQTLHTQHILGSLLAQLSSPEGRFYDDLKNMYTEARAKSAGKPPKLGIDVLSNLLKKQADHRRIYLFIDGVNECSQPYDIFQIFENITKASSNIQVFVSSIDEKGIGEYAQRLPALIVETLRPRDIRNDISLHVHSTLETQPRLKQLSVETKGDITWALTKGAQGMFRWVQCQLDVLSKLRTPGAVRKALSSLPTTLDKTYEEMLLRIDGEEDTELTKIIFQCLAFSLGPLTLHEVSTVLQITPGLRSLDESKRLTHPKDILGICGSLLRYSETAGVITLAHHSVKTYLTSNLPERVTHFQLDEKEGHRMLALRCLTYLSYDAFAEYPAHTPNENTNLTEYETFLDYAVQHWPMHVQEAGELSEEIWTVLRSFLLSAESGRHSFQSWVELLVPGCEYAYDTPPLYYASSFGLTTAVRYLLEIGVDFECRGGRGGATPINIAAFRGHLDVVKLLLEHGADPLKPDVETELNAVQWAKYKGRWDVLYYFQNMGYIFTGASWVKDAEYEAVDGLWRMKKPASTIEEAPRVEEALEDVDVRADG